MAVAAVAAVAAVDAVDAVDAVGAVVAVVAVDAVAAVDAVDAVVAVVAVVTVDATNQSLQRCFGFLFATPIFNASTITILVSDPFGHFTFSLQQAGKQCASKWWTFSHQGRKSHKPIAFWQI